MESEKALAEIYMKQGMEDAARKAEADKAVRAERRKTAPVIVIDPGHGGGDPGALGETSGGEVGEEKNLNLWYSNALFQALNDDYQVFMTRNDDSNPSLNDRVNLANGIEADLFISIHCNSHINSEPAGIQGYQRFNAPMNGESFDILKIMERRFKSAGYNFWGDFTRNDRRIYVLSKANDTRVSVLIELGFITNKDDVKRLESMKWATQTITILKASIDEYYGR